MYIGGVQNFMTTSMEAIALEVRVRKGKRYIESYGFMKVTVRGAFDKKRKIQRVT